MMCNPRNCKYIGPEPLNTDPQQFSCEAELGRLADISEIMSDCVSASLVDMTANRHHIYTQALAV